MMSTLTIADVLVFLGVPDWADPAKKFDWLRWPPDVFAVCAYLLRDSGAYTRAVGQPHETTFSNRHDREQRTKEIAEKWRLTAAEEELAPAPEQVKQLWTQILDANNSPLSEIDDSRQGLWAILLQLLSASDEACAGFGLPPTKYENTFDGRADSLILKSLAKLSGQAYSGLPSSLCEALDASRIVVLPKMHTTQVGLTIRSFSHHLTINVRSDVHARWRFSKQVKAQSLHRPRRSQNVLLVPWPYKMDPAQFRPSQCVKGMCEHIPAGQDYFEFEPHDRISKSDVLKLCEVAQKSVGPITGVVFPEMALSASEFNDLSEMLQTHVEFLASGIYQPPTESVAGQNYVKIMFHVDGGTANVTQYKHHRWSLDSTQIVSYGLGGVLDPAKRWWECIQIHKRDIHFIALDSLLVFTVLICEDLARPEPVGDLVRCVGPNLVIALLQDGPQLETRWPSRYAMSLSDDPGCSVLTLTSLGMSRLSRPKSADEDLSRVIALWRDRHNGTRNIVLPRGGEAIVLSLTEGRDEEFTVDGRGDKASTGKLTLAGVHALNRDGLCLF